MTVAEFEALRKIIFFRVSSYEINFSRVVTQFKNERKRRGSYYFNTVLRHEADDQETVRKLSCRLIFLPYKPDFHITSVFATEAMAPNEAITAYLQQKTRMERNFIDEEERLSREKLAGIKVLCALALNNLNEKVSAWELTKKGLAKYEMEEGRVQFYPQGYH